MSKDLRGHVPAQCAEEYDPFLRLKLLKCVGNVGIVHVLGEAAKFADVFGFD